MCVTFTPPTISETFQDFEILVVDDHSNDDTEEIVNNFRDPRIKYLRHAENRRASAARNTGIKAAQGRYITFLDSDDEWLPERLQSQIEVFQTNPHGLNNLGVVTTGWYYVRDTDGKVYKTTIPRNWGYIQHLIFQSMVTGHLSTLIKRECFSATGLYDEMLPASQHWDMFVRLAQYYQFDVVERPLAIFHAHQESHVRTGENTVAAYELLFKKYDHLFKKYPKYASKLHLYIGKYYLLKNDKAGATRHILCSTKLNRLSVMAYVHLLLSPFDSRVYEMLGKAKQYLRSLTNGNLKTRRERGLHSDPSKTKRI